MGVMFLTGAALASCVGPYCWDDVGPTINGNVPLQSYTAAQVRSLSAPAAGVAIYCSDCKAAGAKGTVCISTGTGAFAWSLSSGTVCN